MLKNKLIKRPTIQQFLLKWSIFISQIEITDFIQKQHWQKQFGRPMKSNLSVTIDLQIPKKSSKNNENISNCSRFWATNFTSIHFKGKAEKLDQVWREFHLRLDRCWWQKSYILQGPTPKSPDKKMVTFWKQLTYLL